MREFFRFLINPSHIVISESKLYAVLNSFFVLFALVIIQIILQLLFLIFWQDNSDGLRDYNDSLNEKYNILITCLVAPIFEEFTFRLLLTKFNDLKFKVSISLFIGSFLLSILYLVTHDSTNPFVIQGIIGLLIFFLIRKLHFEKVKIYWEANFNTVFWTSQLLFCLVHIPQFIAYEFDYVLLLRTLISIQLSSLILSFARMKYGITYSIFIHCLYNFIALEMSS
jgi:membrane protease YdiL (CAAX protease family)